MDSYTINKTKLGCDVIKLANALDKELEEQELDPNNGLSPQRNEIYADYFDRLIIFLNDEYDCTEVANLLCRIRDELFMTANSYKKLYESSVTFGIQKALTARHENESLRGVNKALEDKITTLKDQNDYLMRKISVLEQNNLNQRVERQNRVTNRLSRFGIRRGRDSGNSSPAVATLSRSPTRNRVKSPNSSHVISNSPTVNIKDPTRRSSPRQTRNRTISPMRNRTMSPIKTRTNNKSPSPKRSSKR